MSESNPVANLSAEAIRVLEYNDSAIYLAPREEDIYCLFQSDRSFAIALSEIEAYRDELEGQRDRARRTQRSTETNPRPSAEEYQIQIDVPVIIERTVKYIRADAGPERGRHYRRVSALCDDPATVIENVEEVLESVAPASRGGRLSNIVRRWLPSKSAADRERREETQ